jgi:hypothetical protein
MFNISKAPHCGGVRFEGDDELIEAIRRRSRCEWDPALVDERGEE